MIFSSFTPNRVKNFLPASHLLHDNAESRMEKLRRNTSIAVEGKDNTLMLLVKSECGNHQLLRHVALGDVEQLIHHPHNAGYVIEIIDARIEYGGSAFSTDEGILGDQLMLTVALNLPTGREEIELGEEGGFF